MARQSAAKLSISIPRDLAGALKRRVGRRGFSQFATRALRHELQRERLGEYLDRLDDELGPVPADLMEAARRAWRKS